MCSFWESPLFYGPSRSPCHWQSHFYSCGSPQTERERGKGDEEVGRRVGEWCAAELLHPPESVGRSDSLKEGREKGVLCGCSLGRLSSQGVPGGALLSISVGLLLLILSKSSEDSGLDNYKSTVKP